MTICYPLSTGKWLQNEWPWMTLSGYFMTKCVFCQHFLNQSVWVSELVQPLQFCGVLCLRDQLASLGRHAQLPRCFSAVAELLVENNFVCRILLSCSLFGQNYFVIVYYYEHSYVTAVLLSLSIFVISWFFHSYFWLCHIPRKFTLGNCWSRSLYRPDALIIVRPIALKYWRVCA